MGHWAYTDYGWTWVSDYEWGWAPFHYGRWDRDDYYGWFWVPGHEWGPAWVVWSRSDNYYGWAPLRPGISLSVAYGRDYYIPADRWVFVNERYIEDPHINRYYEDRGRNVVIINHTRVIDRTYEDRSRHVTYASGPDRDEVQRATGRTVRTVSVRDNDQPGQRSRRGEIQMYRPEFQRSNEQEHRPVPTRVVRSEEVRRTPDRNSNTHGRDEQYDNRTHEQNRHQAPADNNVQEKQTRTVAPVDNNNRREQHPTDNTVRDQPAHNPSNNYQQTRTDNHNVVPVNNNQPQPVKQNTDKPADNKKEQPHSMTQPDNRQNGSSDRRDQPHTSQPAQTQNNTNHATQPAQQPQQQKAVKPSEKRNERKAKADEEKKKDDSNDRRR
jgi:hypothetical protein